MNKYLLVFILLLFKSAPVLSFAQNTDTTKYEKNFIPPLTINPVHALFNSIILNPAYTGIFGEYNVQVTAETNNPFFNYRNFYLPFQAHASYDMAFGKNKNNALGGYYSNAQGGIYKGMAVGINYARNIDLTHTKFYHKLRLGASVVYNRATYDKLFFTTQDQIDPYYCLLYTSDAADE